MVESLFNGGAYPAVKAMLDVATARHHALATNIAHVETPGYKRVDLAPDFAKALEAGLRARDHRGVAGMAVQITRDPTALASRTDGNNVQLDRELLAMSSNAANFEVLTQFASSSLKRLQTAITGRVN